MCALFGSADRGLFQELAALNSYRGNHSYSVSVFDFESVNVVDKSLGEFTMPQVVGPYYLGHTQAPTTEAKSIASIHPSTIEGTYLWHNGIIKENQVKAWQQELNLAEPWDTKLMHQLLYYKAPAEVLNKADGSFACVWYHDGGLYLFRNANCPLFTDGTNYSSTKFSGSDPIKDGILYRMMKDGIVETDITFATYNEFFWSPE